MPEISVLAPDGIGEVEPGTDLAELAVTHLEPVDGDVVVITSKVVSKAEGRTRPGDDASYEAAFAEETVRVVARRGPTRIVRNRLGLVMAAAGIDRSNVAAGTLVLLPEDPDASARAVRRRIRELTGANVGVVVTDTAGRAWREGQTDIAIGVAGLHPAEQFAGRQDAYGNPLAVTLPAVADEVAGAAELAQGKLGARPMARLRGRADLVLPPDVDGPGAVSLQRAEGGDLFGLGAREAVVTALSGETEWLRVFGSPAPTDDLVAALARVAPGAYEQDASGAELACTLEPGATPEVVSALCRAYGWRLASWTQESTESRAHALLRPVGP